MSSSCRVHPSAVDVSKCLNEVGSDYTPEFVSRMIESAERNNQLSVEEEESLSPQDLASKLAGIFEGSASVSVDLPVGTAIHVNSTESFSNDSARSQYATHFIGFRSQPKMAEAYEKANKEPLKSAEDVRREPHARDIVAVAKLSAATDFEKAWPIMQSVLDAGGRIILPLTIEFQMQMDSIKNEEQKTKYTQAYADFRQRLAAYGQRTVERGVVVQRPVTKADGLMIRRLVRETDDRGMDKWVVRREPYRGSTVTSKGKKDFVMASDMHLAAIEAKIEELAEQGVSVWDETFQSFYDAKNSKEVLNGLKDAYLKGVWRADANRFTGDPDSETESDYQRAVDTVFSVRTRTDTTQRNTMQAKVFDNNYDMTIRFGRSLASLFVGQCEKAVVPKKIEQYKSRIERLNKKLADKVDENGEPLSLYEINKIKERVGRLYDIVNLLEEEGWLGAIRVPDVMNATLATIKNLMRNAEAASTVVWNIRKKNPDIKGKDMLVKFKKETGVDFRDVKGWELVQYDIRRDGFPFLHKLFDGYNEMTDAELRAAAERKGDTATIAKLDSRGKVAKENAEKRDAEIEERRREADELRADALNLMVGELTQYTGLRFPSSKLSQTKSEEIEEYKNLYSTLMESDEQLEDVDDESAENDSDKQDDSVRDEQMMSLHERNIADTLSKKARCIISTQYEWHQENGAWTINKDDIFRTKKRVASGVVYNKLLEIVNGKAGNERITDGKKLYDFLKENESYIPWAHGLVLAMEKDPSVRTTLFVAMTKSYHDMRSMRVNSQYNKKNTKRNDCTWVTVAENYNSAGASVTSSIQETVNNGLVLVHEDFGDRRFTADFREDRKRKGSNKRIVDKDIEVKDISLYTPSGYANLGDVEFAEDGVTVKSMSGSYGLLAFFTHWRNHAEKAFDDRIKSLKDSGLKGDEAYRVAWSEMSREDREDLATILRAVGVNCDADSLRYALMFSQWKYRELIKGVDSLIRLSCPNYNSAIRRYDQGQTLCDSNTYLYRSIGNALSSLSESTTLSSYMWGDRQYYSWVNRSLLDDLADDLLNSDYETIRNRVYELVGADVADESFLYKRDGNGDPIITNSLLRFILDAARDYDTADSQSDRFRMEGLRQSFFHSGGYLERKPDGKIKATEYRKMSVAQKVTVEMQNFFAPKDSENKLLGRDVTQYALPIMSDSPNHIFMGGQKFDDMLSHESGGFLDECAGVVMQEYGRISAHLANGVVDADGNVTEIARPEFSKTYAKNCTRFNYFKSLNDVTVRIDGRDMPFLDALRLLLTDESENPNMGSVTFTYEGKEHTVAREAGRELSRSLMMEAVRVTYLVPQFKEAMRFWTGSGLFKGFTSNNGVFKFDEINTDLSDGADPIKQAGSQYSDRQLALHELLGAIASSDDRIKQSNPNRLQLEYSKESGKYTLRDIETGANFDIRSEFWDALGAYQGDGITGADLQAYVAWLGEMSAFSWLYDLGAEEFAAAKRRLQAISFAVANIAYERVHRMEQMSQESGQPIAEADKPLHDALVQLIKTHDASARFEPNLLYKAMRDFAWNKMFFKMEISQILVGDIAQFKGEGDISKRGKFWTSAYDRCDESAVDTLSESHPGELVRDYYGEDEIPSEKWRANQKTVTVADLEVSKPSGSFFNQSDFFEKQMGPQLAADLQAGIITPQEYAESCSSYLSACTTDGQTFRPFESFVKLLKFLDLCTPAIQRLYQAICVERRPISWAEAREGAHAMKTVEGTFQQRIMEYTDAEGNLNQYALRFADYVKDSSFCLMMYTEQMTEYLGGKDSVLVGLLNFASTFQIDAIHFASTKKIGETNIVNISDCRNAQEVYDTLHDRYFEAYSEAQMRTMRQGDLLKNSLDEDNFPRDPAKDILHAEPWKNVGRQVSTQHEHLVDKTQGVGSQISKIALCDMGDTWDGLVVDEAGNPVLDKDGKAQRQTYDTYVTLRDDDGKDILRVTPGQMREMVARIQITNMLEDVNEFEEKVDTKEGLSKLLTDELKRSGRYTEDMIYAISINPETGDFNLPLDHPDVISALQPILSSVVQKQIVKQRTAGGTAIQFTSYGVMDNLKSVWGVDEKSGQKYCKYVECKLPAWTKKLFFAFSDKDGNIDINKMPPSLRSLVGYRVPTEYLYSIVPIRVVGFLEPGQGTSIMLPQDIVVWSGSDFDVDKIYLEIPDFEIAGRMNIFSEGSGKAWNAFFKKSRERAAKGDGVDWGRSLNEMWREALGEFYSDPDSAETLKRHGLPVEMSEDAIAGMVRNDPATFKKMREAYCDAFQRGEGRLLDILDIKNSGKKEALLAEFNSFAEDEGLLSHLVNIEGDVDERLALLNKKGPFNILAKDSNIQWMINSMSRMQRENLLVKLHHSRLTSDFSLRQINKPGGFTKQKRLAKLVAIIESGRSEKSFAELDRMSNGELDAEAQRCVPDPDIFAPHADDVLFGRNMLGAQMIGICAVHNAAHAVAQAHPIELSGEFTRCFNFTLNGLPMRTEFGVQNDEYGKSVMLNIGGFLSASVDNAKDPVLGYLNLTPVTADTFLALLHMGYSVESVVYLMNQPIVKRLSDSCVNSASFAAALRKIYDRNGLNEMSGDENALTIDELAEGLRMRDASDGELYGDPVQRSALRAVACVSNIANAAWMMMKSVDVAAHNKNFQNSVGGTIVRMAPALYPASNNTVTFTEETEDGKSKRVDIDIFDKKQNAAILADHTIFDGGTPALNDADTYIRMMKEGSWLFPIQQACYDIGIRRVMYDVSRHVGAYHEDFLEMVQALNQMADEPTKLNLDEKEINDMAGAFRTFWGINALVAEEREKKPELSVVQVQRAFLKNFPTYFNNLLRSNLKDGVDLRSEFRILRHIVYDHRVGDSMPKLRFTRGGEVDKLMQDDLKESWLKLKSYKDPEVRQLAYSLYKYAFFYNGANFSPIMIGQYAPTDVLKEFRVYNERMRELPDGVDDETKCRFLDQYIRNNADWAEKKGIIKKVKVNGKNFRGMLDTERENVFRKEQRTEYGRTVTAYVPNDEFDYDFKSKRMNAKQYLRLGHENTGEFKLYRHVGKYHYVRISELGTDGFYQYDNESDFADGLSTAPFKPASIYESLLNDINENALLGEAMREERMRRGNQKSMEARQHSEKWWDTEEGRRILASFSPEDLIEDYEQGQPININDRVFIEDARMDRESIRQKHPDAVILDLTSNSDDSVDGIPLKLLSPFYPHGNIPVPGQEGMTATCVEAIWQGLKVFDNAGADYSMFNNDTMRNLKRRGSSFGKVKGHQYGDKLLGYQDARRLIYLPAYEYVLNNVGQVRRLVDAIKNEVENGRKYVFLDYDTNADINNVSTPLSHASLVRSFLNKEIKSGQGAHPRQESTKADSTPHSFRDVIEFWLGKDAAAALSDHFGILDDQVAARYEHVLKPVEEGGKGLSLRDMKNVVWKSGVNNPEFIRRNLRAGGFNEIADRDDAFFADFAKAMDDYRRQARQITDDTNTTICK